MKITVWTFTSCIPEDRKPTIPDAFGSEAEALARADEIMRSEWGINGPDDEAGVRLPYPGDWSLAQDAILAAEIDETWGKWALNSHEIEIGIARRPAGHVLASHTPGPFTAWADGRTIGIEGPEGFPIAIAEVVDHGDMADEAQLLADQSLFAAAPDMLAALKHMRSAYGKLHDIISDCVEGGRLTAAHLPDDYMAIADQLEKCATADAGAESAVKLAEIAPPGDETTEARVRREMAEEKAWAGQLTIPQLTAALYEMRDRGAAVAYYDAGELETMFDDGRDFSAFMESERSALEEAMCDAAREYADRNGPEAPDEDGDEEEGE